VANSRKVLVVDSSPDLLELSRILLSAEGYEVATSAYEATTLAAIKVAAPDVILFDLVKDRYEPWALLEELRQDPLTREIGVMVTSASASLIERALANPALGISNGLLMPFDIDDLYARLEETLNRAEITAPAESALAVESPALVALARFLTDEQRNLLFRWVQRISILEPYRQQPGLSLKQAMGEMEPLLSGMIEVLGDRDVAHDGLAGSTSLAPLVATHVALRLAQGLSLADVVREFHVLRQEISRLPHSALHTWRLDLDDLLTAQEQVNTLIDDLVMRAVQAGAEPAALDVKAGQ